MMISPMRGAGKKAASVRHDAKKAKRRFFRKETGHATLEISQNKEGRAKRFKITATGKVMRYGSGKRHLLDTSRRNTSAGLGRPKRQRHA